MTTYKMLISTIDHLTYFTILLLQYFIPKLFVNVQLFMHSPIQEALPGH